MGEIFNGGWSPHPSDPENWWMHVVAFDEYTYDQNGNPSTSPFTPIINLLALLP